MKANCEDNLRAASHAVDARNEQIVFDAAEEICHKRLDNLHRRLKYNETAQ